SALAASRASHSVRGLRALAETAGRGRGFSGTGGLLDATIARITTSGAANRSCAPGTTELSRRGSRAGRLPRTETGVEIVEPPRKGPPFYVVAGDLSGFARPLQRPG